VAKRARTAGVECAGDVMTVDQVAAYLQLNRLTVYRYVREGKIPASKIGKVYRILRADVDRFLEALKTPASVRQPQPLGQAGRQGDTTRPQVQPRRPRAAPPPARRAEEIYMGPQRPGKRRDWDSVILSGEPLEVIIRGLH